MRPIAIDVLWSVCLSVCLNVYCLLVTTIRTTNKLMLFGLGQGQEVGQGQKLGQCQKVRQGQKLGQGRKIDFLPRKQP